MPAASAHKHHPIHDVPEELAPGSLPVEPDEGPAPVAVPGEEENDGVIDPEA